MNILFVLLRKKKVIAVWKKNIQGSRNYGTPNSTMSVILRTRTTIELKEKLLPSYLTLENSFIWIYRCGFTSFPYFKAIRFWRYCTWSKLCYFTLVLLLSPFTLVSFESMPQNFLVAKIPSSQNLMVMSWLYSQFSK